MQRFGEKYGLELSVQVGLATGELVAGVIGDTKFSYDMWGDTVNTASRMYSHALADMVQITEATQAELESRYVIEPRAGDGVNEQGQIFVKGKGWLRTFVLKKRREGAECAAICL